MRRVIFGLVVVQALLVVGYLFVERARAPRPPFAVERLDEQAPQLQVEFRDGTVALAASRDRVVLVHFWATWCAPCREELPGLIEAARKAELPLLAVTDEPWETVTPYFDGAVPAEVVRDPSGEGAGRFSVSGLPETFVVRDGRVIARTGGARDWQGAGDFLGAIREGEAR